MFVGGLRTRHGNRPQVTYCVRGERARSVRIKVIFILPVAAPAACQRRGRVQQGGRQVRTRAAVGAVAALPRLDVHDHFDFVHGGDFADGRLRAREHFVETGACRNESSIYNEAGDGV
jgi:hypothetical protein